MTEITQAARDAAMRWAGALPRGEFEHLLTIADDAAIKNSMAERAAIVAWLRTQDDPNEKWALQNSHWYAAEIEAGAHTQ